MNFQTFILENKETSAYDMHRKFRELALENNINLNYGHNNFWGITPEEEQVFAFELNDDLMKVFDILEVSLEPSYKEIEKELLSKQGIHEVDVTFKTPSEDFKGVVFINHLESSHFGNSLSFWISLNEITVKKDTITNR